MRPLATVKTQDFRENDIDAVARGSLKVSYVKKLLENFRKNQKR